LEYLFQSYNDASGGDKLHENDFAEENYKNVKKTGQRSKNNQKNWK
jgi:hypothetical protein